MLVLIQIYQLNQYLLQEIKISQFSFKKPYTLNPIKETYSKNYVNNKRNQIKQLDQY